jgi:YHS domain-containing protein
MRVECAVCEVELDSGDAYASLNIEEEPFYFCSEKCRWAFQDDPALFFEEFDEAAL